MLLHLVVGRIKYRILNHELAKDEALNWFAEVDYTELVEYVRMAVILIYQDLHHHQMTEKAGKASKHLH